MTIKMAGKGVVWCKKDLVQKAACATLRSEISAKGLKCNKGAKAVRCKRLLVQKLFNVRVLWWQTGFVYNVSGVKVFWCCGVKKGYWQKKLSGASFYVKGFLPKSVPVKTCLVLRVSGVKAVCCKVKSCWVWKVPEVNGSCSDVEVVCVNGILFKRFLV